MILPNFKPLQTSWNTLKKIMALLGHVMLEDLLEVHAMSVGLTGFR
jgi:hypothetical protein